MKRSVSSMGYRAAEGPGGFRSLTVIRRTEKEAAAEAAKETDPPPPRGKIRLIQNKIMRDCAALRLEEAQRELAKVQLKSKKLSPYEIELAKEQLKKMMGGQS